MASSRGTSNGPDWKDVTQALVNYERFWGCQITLSIHLDGSNDVRVMMLEARADPTNNSNSGLLHSVLVSASMRSLNAVTLSAAILNVLHKLDREVEVAKPMGSGTYKAERFRLTLGEHLKMHDVIARLAIDIVHF